MNIDTLYIFEDTPKRYCFSKYNSVLKLPKAVIQWIQLPPEAVLVLQNELPQPESLIAKISTGILNKGFYVVDFGKYSVMLKYLYLDWEEKWEKYTTIESKSQIESGNLTLWKESKEAGKIAIEALNKWVNLIKTQLG